MAEGNIKIGVDASGARQGAEEARKALEGVGAAARASAMMLAQMAGVIDDVGGEAMDAAKDVDKLSEAEVEAAKAAKQVKDAAAKAAKEVDRLKKAEIEATKAAKGMKGAVAKLVIALGGMLVLYDVINSLKAFEDGLVGVGKTTNILGPDLDGLGQDIIGLSRNLRTGTDELLAIAQTAGQLGVTGKEGILAFTETMAMLGNASNLVGEEGATKLARMLNIAGEAPETVGTLAAVIVELGNNFAATEKNIAHSATQVALATAAFGVSSAEASAFGAVLASLGVRAETGGSSMGRVFRVIDKAVRGSAVEMEALKKITGKTAEEISTTFRKSSAQGVKDFIEGLGDVAAVGGDTTAALESLGLKGEEILKVLPSMAINSDLLGEAFGRMSDQLVNQDALLNENERAMDTFGAEVGRLSNAYGAIKLSMLGTNGVLKAATGFFADVMFAMAGVKDEANGVTTAAEATAVALKVLVGVGVAAAILAMASAVVAFGVATKIATAATVLWNAVLALNPVVWIAAAVVGVATAFALLASDVDEATESLKSNNNELDRFDRHLENLGKSRAAEVVAERQGDFGSQIQALKSQIQTYNQTLVDLQGEVDEGTAKPRSVVEVAEMVGVSPQAVSDAIYSDLTSGVEDAVGALASNAELRAAIGAKLGSLFTDIPLAQGIDAEMQRESEALKNRNSALGSGQAPDPLATAPKASVDIGAILGLPKAEEEVRMSAEEMRAALVEVVNGPLKGADIFAGDFQANAADTTQQVRILEGAIAKAEAEIRNVELAWEDSKQAAIDAANAPTEAMLKGIAALEAYRDGLDATEESLRRILEGTATPQAEAAESQILSQLADARAKIQDTLKEGAVVDEKDLKPLEDKLRLLAELAAQVGAKATQDALTLSIREQTEALATENAVRAAGGDAIDLQLKTLELELIDKEVGGRVALLAALRDELVLKQRLSDADRELAQDKAATEQAAKKAEATARKGAQAVADMFTALEMERQALGKNNMERQRFTELLQLENALRAAGVADTKAVLDAYEQEVMKLQEMAFFEEMAGSISQAFGTAFNDIVMGTATAQEAFQSMMESIGRMLLSKLVTEPLMESITEKLAGVLPDLFDSAIEIPEKTLGESQAASAQIAAATEAAGVTTSGATTAAATVTTAATTAATTLQDGMLVGAAAITEAAAALSVGSAVEAVPAAATDTGAAATQAAATQAAGVTTSGATTAAATLTTAATTAAATLQDGMLVGAAAITEAAAVVAAGSAAEDVSGGLEGLADSPAAAAQIAAAAEAASIGTIGATTTATILTTAATTSATTMKTGMLAGAAAIQAAAAALAIAAKAAAAAKLVANAKGNVFSGGNIVPFAYGGVVGKETTFPLADGRMGLMGEAGPEAIMPLSRGKDGKLGVKGGGGQTINNITNVRMNVTATDADSFRKSRRQISQDLRKI